jgi:hypothetical protein
MTIILVTTSLAEFTSANNTRVYTTVNTRWEATQRVMAAKLTGLTHKIGIQLHLVAESCANCSCRSRRPVRKLLDTPYLLPFVCMWSVCGSVSIGTELKAARPGFVSWQWEGKFFSSSPRPDRPTTQPPMQWVPRILSPGECWHLRTRPKVENENHVENLRHSDFT